jgi:hypothetical protein
LPPKKVEATKGIVMTSAVDKRVWGSSRRWPMAFKNSSHKQ